jgi:membrane fusion protein, multidrug efflux system
MTPKPTSALLLLALALAPTACEPPEQVDTSPPPVPVRLESVEPRPFQPTLSLLGVVEPSDRVAVTARVTGPLEYPAFPGGLRSGVEVRRGQVLIRQRLASAEHQLEVARLAAEAAAGELERHREAWDQGLESAATLEAYRLRAELAREQLRAAQEERGELELRAPVDGRLAVERRYPPGSQVAAGTVIAEILTEARQVRAWASSADRQRLEVGQPVQIGSSAAPGAPASGRVLEIAPIAERGGAYAVIVQPVDPGHLPPPGEGVELEVLLAERQRALTVPEEALVITGDGASVFVAVRAGGELRAERRNVAVGERARDERSEGRVEVLEGLARGDRVVVEGASLLADGTPVVAVAAPGDDAEAPGGSPAGESE